MRKLTARKLNFPIWRILKIHNYAYFTGTKLRTLFYFILFLNFTKLY